MSVESPYLDEKQAAKWLRVSPNTLRGWRVSGKGPRFSKLGSRVRYDRTELDSWFNAQQRSSTTTEPTYAK